MSHTIFCNKNFKAYKTNIKMTLINFKTNYNSCRLISRNNLKLKVVKLKIFLSRNALKFKN